MKDVLKIGSLLVALGLFGLSIALMFLGMAGLFAYGTIKLGLFYLSIFIVVYLLNRFKKGNMLIYSVLGVLFFVPFFWFLIDNQSLIDFLMDGLELDMK